MRTKAKRVVDLKTAIRNQIWASGEPENLVSAHDGFFQEAFAQIAQWVTCERDDNVNIVRFENTFYKNGMTVIPAPRGVIRRVFTVANEDYSDPVILRMRSWPWPEQWARNLYLSPKADPTKATKLPTGFNYPDAANDSLYGRARTGVFALNARNLYLAPWIQSNELIVIEWSGIKEEWGDFDLINPEQSYREAVKLWVQYCDARDYGEMGTALKFHDPARHDGFFDEALATMINQCTERQRVSRQDPEDLERNRLCSELADDWPATGVTDFVVAHIGNGSALGANLDLVGNLIRNWGPKAITGAGFITAAQTDYDQSAGDQFHDYLTPYAGTLGEAGRNNALWPAAAAYDWTKDALATFDEFFNNPVGASYYTVVVGDVQLFVLDTNAANSGGITSGGIQGAWLQSVLSLSTAAWKVVVMDQSPYGSVHSNATLQWPFKLWGADLVLCSQAVNYERLSISDLPVINNGLGGLLPIEDVANPSANTVTAYSEKAGAGRVTTKDTSLVWEFWNVDGKLIDTLELSK